MRDIEQAVALAPERAYAYIVRANMMKEIGRRDDAIKDYRRALELKPSQETRKEAEAGLAGLGAAANPVRE
jgi:Tfp pilus assembly protein PilF